MKTLNLVLLSFSLLCCSTSSKVHHLVDLPELHSIVSGAAFPISFNLRMTSMENQVVSCFCKEKMDLVHLK